jgi:hypothetical protein
MAALGEDITCLMKVVLEPLEDLDLLAHRFDLGLEELGHPLRGFLASLAVALDVENGLDLVEGEACCTHVGNKQEFFELAGMEETMAAITALGGAEDLLFFVEADGTKRTIGETSHITGG